MIDNNEVVKVENETNVSWEHRIQKENVVAPAVNVYETANEYVLNADMPGVTKENIRLKINKRELTLVGLVNYDELVKRKYVLSDNLIGNFYRKFNLSDWIDIEKIAANFENGQLKVVLPKQERFKPRDIQVF